MTAPHLTVPLMASAVLSSTLCSSFVVLCRTQNSFPVPKEFSQRSFRKQCLFAPTSEHKSPVGVPTTSAEVTVAEGPMSKLINDSAQPKNLRILIAGGGIGGLVFALAAKRKGFQVQVFEKDMSAIRGEGQYRGPIQIQSNALAALEAIDMDVAEEIMAAGCITGDRINGLVDGISGDWYIKFDTFTPAAERGLPVTRVISQMTLQQILARTVGDDFIMNDSEVVDFEDDGNKITVKLENGRSYEGDLLVGADSISTNNKFYTLKVRKNLFGPSEASYSGYTCYTGIADFVPPDIDCAGYRVLLGHKQYFVSSDVGAGKMQWSISHHAPEESVVICLPQVSEKHACIHCKDTAFYLTDLQSQHGTWITDKEGRRYHVPPHLPVRFHPSDRIEFGSQKASFRVKVMMSFPETKQSHVLQAA